MSHDADALAQLLADTTLRPMLEEIGARLRVSEPAEVLRVAFAAIMPAGEEKAPRGARLFLQYLNGDPRTPVLESGWAETRR
jgi:hypothetical protein